MNARHSEGQTLVLFALVLTVLVGISALVVDVGMKYAVERRYQAVADAASLAGAQDLQPVSRNTPVSVADQRRARTDALRVVLDELAGGAVSTCNTNNDIDDCPLPGGQFRVSIRTPSPNCVDCVPDRSVQVTIREPEHRNGFATLYGQPTWDLSRTSVAGLSFGKAYTIVALRPPQPNGQSGQYDVRDIVLAGGTNVYVRNGDVGTNSNMKYDDVSGNTKMHIVDAPGYGMYYYDPYNGPEWTPPNPPDPVGKKIGSMIKDPGYVIPGPPLTHLGSFAVEDAGSPCALAAETLLASSAYGSYMPSVTATEPDMDKITCLLPGYFANDPFSGRYSSLSSDVVILLTDPDDHGLFYFGGGLKVQSSLIGGFVSNRPGVALVIPQDEELNINTNGSPRPTALMLNAGTRLAGGSEASPATDFDGRQIVTNTDPAVKMTLMVTRDLNCVQPNSVPRLCTDGQNDAIKIAGQSDLYIAGVQFMPSDQSSINSSATTGYIGQIWSWTIKYSGGVTLDQEGTGADGPGHIRIDTACSPGEPQDTCY